MPTPDLNSRIQIIDNPIAHPAVCIVCMSAGSLKRKFIDFGFSIEWYGAVYFCTICFSEIARALDFVGFSTYQTLLSSNQELKGALDNADRRIESLNDTLRNCLDNSVSVNTLRDVSNSEPSPQTHISRNSDTDRSSPDDDDSSGIEESGDILDDSKSSTPTAPAENPLQF